jgi:multicomponent Na+:H+ antiporter subunit E
VLARFALLGGFWLLLDGGGRLGLLIGLPVAALAALVSCRLAPPGQLRVRAVPLARLLGVCLRESVTAGWDVALRALRPDLPLRVGLVRVPCAFPAGPHRNVLCAAGSLMPGSLPVGEDADGAVILHVLDTDQPAAAQTERLANLVGEAFPGHA